MYNNIFLSVIQIQFNICANICLSYKQKKRRDNKRFNIQNSFFLSLQILKWTKRHKDVQYGIESLKQKPVSYKDVSN